MTAGADSVWNTVSQLVEAQLYDRATPAEAARLEQLLRDDPQARKLYYQYIDDCVALSASGGVAGTAAAQTTTVADAAGDGPVAKPGQAPQVPPTAKAPDAATDSPASRWPAMLMPSEWWLDVLPTVMFAALMISVGIFVGKQMFEPSPQAADAPLAQDAPKTVAQPTPRPEVDSPPRQPVQVATLVGANDCEWLESPADIRPGSLLFEGQRLRLATGTALVVMRSGTSLVMEGPTTLSIEQLGRLNLKSGEINVRVTPEAVGFTVDTPLATVVDLGTEFSVHVGPDEVSEVHVFAGEVSLCSRPTSGSARNERLPAGEARRLPSADPLSWSHIALAPERSFEVAQQRALNTPEEEITPTHVPPETKAADAWRPVVDEALSGDNEPGWQQVLQPYPSLGSTAASRLGPAVVPTPHGVKLINGAGLLLVDPVRLGRSTVCRVRADVSIGAADDTLYLVLRGKGADKQPSQTSSAGGGLAQLQGVACMFGAHTPENNRTIAVMIADPGGQSHVVEVPCPAPRVGGRYLLQAIDDGQHVRFTVEMTGRNGWTKQAQLELPDSAKTLEGRIGIGNLGPWLEQPVETVVERFTVELSTNTGTSAPDTNGNRNESP